MKKILALTVLLGSILCSCDTTEDTAIAEQEAVITKTDDMVLFERMITNIGTAKGENEKAQALTDLVAASRQYITDNSQTVPADFTDAQIINKALDIHLQRIIDLKNNQ